MFNTYANDKLNDNSITLRDDEDPLLATHPNKKPPRKLKRNRKRRQCCYIYMGLIFTLGLVAFCFVTSAENSTTTLSDNHQRAKNSTQLAPAPVSAPATPPEIGPKNPLPPLVPTPAPTRNKTILLWNANAMEQSIDVGEYHCIITNQHNYYGSETSSLSKFDAIVFDVAALNFTIYHGNNTLRMPRDAHQNYIYFAQEPPVSRKQFVIAGRESYFYNLTWTYNLRSDIIYERFKVRRKFVDGNSTCEAAPALHPSWMQPPTTTSTVDVSSLYAVKSIAARIDLNAPCNGIRKELVEEFQEYMTVDVYGDCGATKFCINNCTKYYFYLAFESSHCTDYISSDFYTALEMNMVPVVFGGADYTRFAPPYSYIDAKDYGSFRELVEYLDLLIVTPAEYMKYFWWHDVYEFIELKESLFEQCIESCQKLCKFLHENNKTHNEIHNWWQYNDCQKYDKISE